MIYPCPEGLTKRRHPSVCKMAVVIQILPEVDTICRSDGDRGPHRANFTAPIINTERNCVSLCYLLWRSRKHSQFRVLASEITCTAGRFLRIPSGMTAVGAGLRLLLSINPQFITRRSRISRISCRLVSASKLKKQHFGNVQQYGCMEASRYRHVWVINHF